MNNPPGSTSLAPNIGAPNARAHEFAWNCTSSHTSVSLRDVITGHGREQTLTFRLGPPDKHRCCAGCVSETRRGMAESAASRQPWFLSGYPSLTLRDRARPTMGTMARTVVALVRQQASGIDIVKDCR